MTTPVDPSPSHSLHEDFEDFFENSLSGLLITTAKGEVLRGNSRIASWLGRSTEDLKGVRFSELLTIGGQFISRLICLHYCEYRDSLMKWRLSWLVKGESVFRSW
jgi:PAS domain-containing protein